MVNHEDNSVEASLRLTEDIYLTSNSPSDNRWKINIGYVIARPHEYLIHTRGSKILRRSTGQGSRCFKLPGDTVILVPTSLKQLVFEAGQLTLDNIHVRIRGFAIYRISQPEKTFSRISFYNRVEGERKLALMIGEPCRSHTKWLVSNMTVEDCIRKRKEAIADILLQELRSTITEETSGVVIETIDIQDIRFGDDKLFEAYQAPTRESIIKSQQLAVISREKGIETAKMERDQALAVSRKETKLHQLLHDTEVHRAEQEHRILVEQDKRKAEREKLEHDLAISDDRDDNKRKQQEMDAKTNHDIRLAELELEQKKVDIDNLLSDPALQRIFLEKSLPQVTEAVISSLENAQLTIYQGDGSGALPLSIILNEIMNAAKTKLKAN